jgi:hypothetical protein
LVQEGSGEGSWWVASFRRIREREWRGLLQGFLNYAQDLHGSPFYSFQALKDKGERGHATEHFVQRVVVVLE